jgi:23S rRNA pseudouridine1911/1915/1917 synthase
MDSKILITTENAGIRLDVFLAKEFFSFTRGEIIRNIKKGIILVNGKEVKPSYQLKENDEIESKLVFERAELIPNKEIKIPIIYSDENIIVVNKPAGLQVHPSSTEKEKTLVNGLIVTFPEIKEVHDDSLGAFLRPGIVHRLDKDTTGVMVVARNQKTFWELKELFQERKIHKKYVALIFGQLKEKKGIITKAIARSANYKKQVVAGAKTKTKIRSAVTQFKVLEKFQNYSLVEAMPLTGRMHQIRIHFFSLGHPVVGDKKYQLKFSKNQTVKNAARQLLHAREITFQLRGKKFSFSAPIPQDFQDFLADIE